jgi:RNA polymerase sigma-70 factor (sigma-E family)
MARDDDEEAFAEYVAGALPRLRRVAYLLCQDWHRADDLTQSALTRLYVHWHRAEAMENLDAYVGAILLNTYLSEQRTFWWKRTRVRPEPIERPPASESADAARVEELLDLQAALRTLAPRRRAVVVLRFCCDFSVEQTAKILGCSNGTVKSQTARALTQLRGVLDVQTSDEPNPTTNATSYRVGPSMPGRSQ